MVFPAAIKEFTKRPAYVMVAHGRPGNEAV